MVLWGTIAGKENVTPKNIIVAAAKKNIAAVKPNEFDNEETLVQIVSWRNACLSKEVDNI